MNDPKKPKQLFLQSQRLSELVGVTDDWRRKQEICGKADEDEGSPEQREVRDDPWKIIDRPTIIQRAAGTEPWHRTIVVCYAGLGKSTNLAWLQAAIADDASSRRLPVLLRLDDSDHEQVLLDAKKGAKAFLARLLENMPGLSGDPAQLTHALERLLTQGRITILIDGLDHALAGDSKIDHVLHGLLSTTWANCPVWLSGRPYAFKECWSLVKDPAWHVVKVQPLTFADADFYLSREVEPDLDKPTHFWLTAVTEEGRHLLSTPRFLHLVSRRMRDTVTAAKCIGTDSFEAVKRLKLSTPADLYYLAYCEPGEFVDPERKLAGEDDAVNSRGLLAQGIKAFLPAKNRPLKYPGLEEGTALDGQNYVEAVENIRAILGALAFEIYAHPEKLRAAINDDSTEPAEPKPLGPFTRAIPPMPPHIYRDFKDAVAARLTAAKALSLKKLNIDDELNLLGKMNVGAVDFLLFRDLRPEGLRWHDRTVQAFFAAHWAVRYGIDDDLKLLRNWIVDRAIDDDGEQLPSFEEYWQFAAAMPDELVDRLRWLRVFRPCFTPPASLTGSHEYVQWCRRMVYHSFNRMKMRSPSTISEWNVKGPAQAAIVAEVAAGWCDIAAGVCNYGAVPTESRAGREIWVPAFRMHEWPVINRWYEAFDPVHRDRPWNHLLPDHQHLLAQVAGREGLDYCPVVNVTWFDAWCFAAWLGDLSYLPSEVRWEHACRKGTAWDYYLDISPSELVNHAWIGRNSHLHTHPVPPRRSSSHRNNNGLYDMLGNVWEWCCNAVGNDSVHRGGSISINEPGCACGYRRWREPDYRRYDVGIRLAAVFAREPSVPNGDDVAVR
jgi:formylglycine-generating enzyme required for sulfatase activity